MYKLFIVVFSVIIVNLGTAQTDPIKKDQTPTFHFLSIEPAMGTHVLGNPDIQVSNLIQFNFKKRFSIVSHTAFGYNIANPRVTDVKQNYSFSIFQKMGLGFTLYKLKSSSTFSILAGGRFNAYSGTLNNSELSEKITTKTESFRPDYGFLYNLKIGRGKYFFSMRLYIPLIDGLPGVVENGTLELGLGIRLK